MNLLIRNARINDPASPFHGKATDVMVREGIITAIQSKIEATNDVEVIDGKGAFLSPGWFDMRVSFREPGDEQKETIRSGQDAAAQGGFTGVLTMPSTHPAVQTNADVNFIRNRSAAHLVEVFPAGVLTENREGKDLSGMYDMKLAGAVAFTDDKKAIRNSGVMLRAMQYAGNMQSAVISFADDPGLTAGLQANESPATTLLGFKGAPSIAEEIGIQRDLSLVAYSSMPVHISGVSTKEAVARLREARKSGLPVTSEVYIYHLLLDDTALEGFSSHYKVKPPLRSAEDVIALREAVLDGTIDVICSDHSPEDIESKDVEFDYAAYGMIGLESFYGVLQEAFNGKLSQERMYELLVANPRKILGIKVPTVNQNESANFTLYHPEIEWTFTKQQIKSRSGNTPFLEKRFKGKVIACGNASRFVKCS